MDNDLDPLNITIKDAIDRSVLAWKQVKPETIRNCFSKVGHKLKGDHPIIEAPSIEISMDPVVWSRLAPNSTVAYKDYVDVDNELATFQTRSEASIVNGIIGAVEQEQDAEEEDDDLIEIPAPLSSRAIQQHIADIRIFLQAQQADTNRLLSTLNDLIVLNISIFTGLINKAKTKKL